MSGHTGYLTKDLLVQIDENTTSVVTIAQGGSYSSAAFGLKGFSQVRAIFKPNSSNPTISFLQAINSGTWDVTSTTGAITAGSTRVEAWDVYGSTGLFRINNPASNTNVRLVGYGLSVT